jgi:DNA-binding CsgD family transcriptional regulator
VVVGRAGERACLDGAFRSASAGVPSTVLVAGEAGIGKTRLVAEFVEDVTAEATVIVGVCLGEGVPYSPIADALRALVRSRPGAEGGWGELGALVPELADGTSRGAPEFGSPGRLRGAFLRLLETLCRDRPVIVVVEDLHWSDDSTRALLMYTMRAARGIPLLFVGTYRSDDLTRRHPLRPFVAELMRLPSTEAIELERLDVAGVAQLVAEIVGGTPAPGVVDDVYARCGGNPFLVEEVIAAGGGRAGRLSQRLQNILLARTVSLSPDGAEVLRIMAIGGPRVDDRLLRRVCSLPSDGLDGALRELLDSHIVEPDGERRGYVFRHALTAEAVYDDALPGERVRLHTAFAEAIGDDPDFVAGGRVVAAIERARHWHRAHHGTEALSAWVEAATEAERMSAYPEALAAYDHVLELWPTVDGAETLAGLDEVELLRRAAEAANWSGVPGRAVTMAQHALALIDERSEPLRASLLAERLGRYSWASGREDDALLQYQRAVELAPEHPPSAERARALAGHAQILMQHWRDTAAAQRAQDAVDAARRVGAVAVEAHALCTLALAQGYLGDEGAALSAMDESARLIEHSRDDDNLWRLWVNRLWLLVTLGHIEAAAVVASRGHAAMRDLGLLRSAGAHFCVNHALALVDLGHWEQAKAILDEEIGRAEPGWWPTLPRQARAWLNWLIGDFSEAERDLDEIERLAPDLTEGQYLAPQAQTVAALAIETEQWETAVQTVAEAVHVLHVEDDDTVVHWETMTAVWLGLWAAANLARERGGTGSAAWLAPHVREFDRLLTGAARRPLDRRTIRDHALLALCEAERRRFDRRGSDADWRRAVQALDALGAVAQRAYARVRLAEALIAEGAQRHAAAAALNEAISLIACAPRSPIRVLAEDVAHRARLRLAHGHEASPRGGQSKFGLTERETEVLRLLADARTNREIGDALFISPKTASVHVSSVMRKLGVTRRAEAARMARRTMLEERQLEEGQR